MGRRRRAVRDGAIIFAGQAAFGTLVWWAALRHHPHPPTPAAYFGGLATFAAASGLLFALLAGLTDRRP